MEIAKALSSEARIVVMDEPTAALSGVEVDRLFAVARSLRYGPTGQGELRPVVHSKSAVGVGREPGSHHHVEFVFDRGARRWSYEQPRTSLGGPDLEEVVHLDTEA